MYQNAFEDNPRDLWNASVNYFKIWYTLNPALRACYRFQESSNQQWIDLAESLTNPSTLWILLKVNIGRNATFVDELGWGIFVKERLNKPLEALYYAARWTNVVFLRAFFETSEIKLEATGGVASN